MELLNHGFFLFLFLFLNFIIGYDEPAIAKLSKKNRYSLTGLGISLDRAQN